MREFHDAGLAEAGSASIVAISTPPIGRAGSAASAKRRSVAREASARWIWIRSSRVTRVRSSEDASAGDQVISHLFPAPVHTPARTSSKSAAHGSPSCSRG